MIQFSDFDPGELVGDYLTDTIHHRRTPGEGTLDLPRFVSTLDAGGVTCAYSVEVFSDELATLRPEVVGRRLGEGTRRVLAAARNRPAHILSEPSGL
jgi:sugar phosphate isomerase/epimerase